MKLLIIVLLVIALIFIIRIYNKLKIPKLGSFNLVSGGVKTGKSTLSVAMALKELRRRRLSTKIYNCFHRKKKLEMPLIYSNVPLKCAYVPLTKDLLLRKERFVYGSVIYVQEASLVADSMCCRDNIINDNLLLFCKLIGHETMGGCIVWDTQCISDVHFAIKRCLSNYYYIHSCHKMLFLPFIVCKVRELFYSDDNTSINVFDKDIEDSMKTIIISKRTWKYFDCYCFSAMTDDLPVNDSQVLVDSLKTKKVVSFKNYKGVDNN